MEDHIVSLEDVTKIYDATKASVKALDSVSMTIDRGDFIVLVGPSGAGKSTLLQVIGSLDRPTRGRVMVEGMDITSQSDDALAHLRLRSLGFIFQAFNLVEVLTVAENVEYPLRLAGMSASRAAERVDWLLRHVGLTDRASHRVTELSGGQRQRVAIARALANSPSLVLADEPTASLDTKTGENIVSLMKSLNEEDGATFLIATHDPRMLAHAKRIVRMEDGRLQDN
jgi:putative ABC transport system ATP-binding protein